jgi:adenylate kinase
MELRSNSRIPARRRSLVPIVVSVLLCASSQTVFSRGFADSKDLEDSRDDESWATEMENRVWAALVEAKVSFDSVQVLQQRTT